MKCGLLGEKLGHSYSPQIHALIGDYEYRLYEKTADEIEAFVRNGDWHGLNVTIPYKKSVIPFCDELTALARDIGSVNTLLRRADGSILGDNTDAFGFELLLREVGFQAEGKQALVLGSGGASATVCECLKRHGADVTVVSRTGPVNYDNAASFSDTALIVNTTPLGMFPNNGKQAIDLSLFHHLDAVIDVIYNPARTALLLQAEELGIPCTGGLKMLVGQGVRAAERFLGQGLPDDTADRVLKKLRAEMQNIVLIGMPGSGKSTVAAVLAKKLGRDTVDADEKISAMAGKSIPEIFSDSGEEGFRKLETAVLAELGKQSGLIISTGGGCVARPENYPILHQNSTIICILRSVDKLAKEGRPISMHMDLRMLEKQRKPFYEAFADYTISNEGTPDETAEKILEVIM